MIKDEHVEKMALAIAEQQRKQKEQAAQAKRLEDQPYYGNGYYILTPKKESK